MTSGPDAESPAAVRPMTREEYATWAARTTESYAEDLAKAHDVPLDVALARARAQFPELLPNGQDSPGTWLLRVLDASGDAVGVLWLGPHPERAGAVHVYDIEIDEAHRGRGLGRAAMLAAEGLVRDAGSDVISLNVFGFNEPARRLYDSLGYRVVATQMTKSLAAEQPTP